MINRAYLIVATMLIVSAGCQNRPGPGPLAPDDHRQAPPAGSVDARHLLFDPLQAMNSNVSVGPFNDTEAAQQPSVTSVSVTAVDAARQQMRSTATMPA